MPIGRPSFQIDPVRLRGLRNEAGLTQAELAKRAYRHLGKSDASATKNYQKIEATGRTSQTMAQALAAVLDSPLGVLLGDAPDEASPAVDRLENQLMSQLESGTNPELYAAIEQARDPGGSNHVRSFALDLLGRIERAQLGQRPEEMERLEALTGWSYAQLMQPATIQGHWLLISSLYGGQQSEIVLGAGVLRDKIEQAAATFANIGESDSVITLREALPWMHVELTSARHNRMRYAFSFVRCQPLASGLQWVAPTWRDRFWLDDPLLTWAFSTANFVVGFDRKVSPADVRRLRVLLQEYSQASEPTSIAVVKGDLNDLPDYVLDSFLADGSSHTLVLNWISSGIWPELKPRLSGWPASCWKISSGSCIDFSLNTPYRLAAERGEKPHFGTKFRLRLVEEVEPGKLTSVPWRSSSVAALAKQIQAQFDEQFVDAGSAVGQGPLSVGSPPG
jgi:transcriptional regulator with XRE-family HTH domain